jgi:hypothetical protein
MLGAGRMTATARADIGARHTSVRKPRTHASPSGLNIQSLRSFWGKLGGSPVNFRVANMASNFPHVGSSLP